MSTISAEIKALDFPNLQGVIVIGGAFLELLGLRTADDIDIAVSSDNWNYLQSQPGWKKYPKGSSFYLRDTNNRFDVWAGWYDRAHEREIKFDELRENTVLYEAGFRVPTIEYQVRLKQWEGRTKDFEDIELLKRLAS